jgi:mitotic spindle assembly checkpoint protein MAD1
MSSVIIIDWHNSNPRRAKTAESQAPSITHTQALTSLRLTHASLLEEHGSTLALLRQEQSQRASVLAASEEQIAEIERLRNEVSRQRQDASTQKRKWEVAERECGFLRALLVRVSVRLQCPN